MKHLRNLKEEINKKISKVDIIENLYSKFVQNHKYNRYCICNYCRLTSKYVSKKITLHHAKKIETNDYIFDFNFGDSYYKTLRYNIDILDREISDLKIERQILKTF